MQIKDLCNKILWIDHGRQIGFSDNVKLMCDAYEEFLISKKLPSDANTIKKLAADFRQRKAEEKIEKSKSEPDKILDILLKADKNIAQEAVRKFIAKTS